MQNKKQHVNKASRSSSDLRDLMWRNKYTSTQSKVRINNTEMKCNGRGRDENTQKN